MPNNFTTVCERDGEWHIGYCAAIPGANQQRRTVEESRQSLAAAIVLIREDRRGDLICR